MHIFPERKVEATARLDKFGGQPDLFGGIQQLVCVWVAAHSPYCRACLKVPCINTFLEIAAVIIRLLDDADSNVVAFVVICSFAAILIYRKQKTNGGDNDND